MNYLLYSKEHVLFLSDEAFIIWGIDMPVLRCLQRRTYAMLEL